VRPEPDWIFATKGGSEVRCDRCGTVESIALPMPIPKWVKAMRRFIREHAKCEEPQP